MVRLLLILFFDLILRIILIFWGILILSEFLLIDLHQFNDFWWALDAYLDFIIDKWCNFFNQLIKE